MILDVSWKLEFKTVDVFDAFCKPIGCLRKLVRRILGAGTALVSVVDDIGKHREVAGLGVRELAANFQASFLRVLPESAC